MSCISLCKYKDIFGKPNEGVHSTRIFGLAFWDLFGMIIIIVLYYFHNLNWRWKMFIGRKKELETLEKLYNY